MRLALVDNGSLQAAAHRQLRTLAADLAERCGVPVQAVSWKHSDRIQAAALAGSPDTPRVPLRTRPLAHARGHEAESNCTERPDGRAWTLAPWVRAQFAAGERDFVFVPFLISAQGAIGSALREDLAALQRELGDFAVEFSAGLASDGTLAAIAASRIREVIAERSLARPPVLLVDHGGPSLESARLRDAVAAAVRAELGSEIGPLSPASLEGDEHPHNRPLLADALAAEGFNRGDVVVAPLFLGPGRHAGPRGDLAQIARAAEDRRAEPPLRCHFAGLIGTHPLAADALAEKLTATLLNRPARSASTLPFVARPTSRATRTLSPISQPSRLSA